MITRRWAVVAALTAIMTTTLVAPTVAAPALRWGPCTEAPEGLQCATLAVPVDYTAPGGERLELAVFRLPSTRPSARRGVLMVNPGGQFASAVGLPHELVAEGLPDSVREQYDIVAFDPRGIGRSTRVDCNLPPGFAIPQPYARDAADVERTAQEARRIAQGCGASPTAHLLPHITTANVARDMDRIRAALGEQKISYLGYSYGGYLGAVYATLFPGRTDRFVLDSPPGPGGINRNDWSRRFGLGMELRFPDFARWAAQRQDTYGLGRTPAEVRAKYFELAERLDRQPIPGMSGATFRGLTFGLLFRDASFPFLAQFWQGIEQGSVVLPPFAQGDFSGLLHLVCNDSDWPSDVRTYQRAVAHDRLLFPMFGAAGANIWPCAFWPVEQREPPVRIGDRGPSNILIVQGLRDPGAPLPDGLEMRAALGNRARLITVDQGGHMAYLYFNNACTDETVTRFLVSGDRPATGRHCP
jgi:pimeloyl-ACP methyl ester carboxylesterase